MGFPNLDRFLVKTILAKLLSFQGAENYRLEQIFDDFEEAEVAEVRQYLAGLTPTGNLRDKGKGRLFVMPSYPLSDLPFPQIGVSVGSEDTADRFLGDETGGDPAEVFDEDENLIAWDLERGYWGSGMWMVQIMAATKEEVIWLSRLCQQAIVDGFDALDALGVKEVALAVADLRPDPQYYPQNLFLRGLKVTAGKVANTWLKRIPASVYRTGVNLTLTEP